MKALILAGGFGTRLRPLTNTRPKHLLPIANRPHIDLVLDLLRAHDVDEVVLTTSYLAEAFGPTVEAARERGLKVQVTHEEEALGTAGAIKNAESVLGDETFLALNGDILTDVDLSELIRFHRSHQATATLLLTRVEDPSAFGVVPTDEEGRVTGFVEKPPPGEAPTDLINAGVYVMEPSILELVPAAREWSAERQLFPQVVEAGEMFATHLEGYWIDIGTPEKYLRANMDAIEGRYHADAFPVSAEDRRLAIERDPDVPHLWSFIATDPSLVAPSARFASAAVGRGCRIGEDAVVFSSVLLPDVHVGRGAVIRDSILGEGVHVEDGVNVSGATVADGEAVAQDREAS